MYAIIMTGGKQYRVKEGEVIDVELLKDPSSNVSFDTVLMLNTGNAIKVGSPTVAGAKVEGELLGETKDKKLIVYKYKRRKNSRVKNGHRQKHSRVKITKIVGG